MADSAGGVEVEGLRGLGEVLQEEASGEERRHLQEVRIDEQLQDPQYEVGQREVVSVEGAVAEHGSQGNQVESSATQLDSTSDGQPALISSREQPRLLVREDHGAGQEDPAMVRARSMERREEDVGQISRSLNFMTGLLSTLVGRVDRMEQWQSASGSVRDHAPMSTEEGSLPTPSAMTPATARSGAPGLLGLDEVDRLQQQLSQVSMGQHGQESGFQRPLASLEKVMAGTFSSDDSETARRRAAEGERGVPGRLFGAAGRHELACFAVWRSKYYCVGVWFSIEYDLASAGYGVPTNVRASTDYGVPANVLASAGYGVPTNVRASAGYGVPTNVQASAGYGVPTNVRASAGYGVPTNVRASAGYGVPENVLASAGYGVPTNVFVPASRLPSCKGCLRLVCLQVLPWECSIQGRTARLPCSRS